MTVETLIEKAKVVLSQDEMKQLKTLMAKAHYEYEIKRYQDKIDSTERFVPTQTMMMREQTWLKYQETLTALK